MRSYSCFSFVKVVGNVVSAKAPVGAVVTGPGEPDAAPEAAD